MAICPECDYKQLDYKIDAKIDQNHDVFVDVDSDSKMEQAAIRTANQHNNQTGHNASSYKFILIGPSKAEIEEQKEELIEDKVKMLKDIISLYK